MDPTPTIPPPVTPAQMQNMPYAELIMLLRNGVYAGYFGTEQQRAVVAERFGLRDKAEEVVTRLRRMQVERRRLSELYAKSEQARIAANQQILEYEKQALEIEISFARSIKEKQGIERELGEIKNKQALAAKRLADLKKSAANEYADSSVPVDGSHSAIHHASATINAVIHTSVSIPLMLGESIAVVEELRAELNSCVDQWLSKRAKIDSLRAQQVEMRRLMELYATSESPWSGPTRQRARRTARTFWNDRS